MRKGMGHTAVRLLKLRQRPFRFGNMEPNFQQGSRYKTSIIMRSSIHELNVG